MSEPEFPSELVERCAKAIVDVPCYRERQDAIVVLRESGHADLVKALQEARAFIERGYGDEDAQIERIDAALCKAGG